MAFKYHDEAIIPFNNAECNTMLENGSKCSQKHCKHIDDPNICELADEPETPSMPVIVKSVVWVCSIHYAMQPKK